VEEAAFLLTEWLASEPVHGSIGFPEIVVPVVVMLRRCLKASNSKTKGISGKEHGVVKVMLERIEDSARWIEQKRTGVMFAPSKMGEVDGWETEIRRKLDDSPLARYLKVQRKAREKRRSLIEKVSWSILFMTDRCWEVGNGTDLTVCLIGTRRKRRDPRRGLIIGPVYFIAMNSFRGLS
jgi:hypothetical protein